MFGAKLSPYIVTGGKPVITAWTALMSMETGQPLMWCDAGLLTTERTAGTTALAVDQLACTDAKRLAIIGAGAVGLAASAACRAVARVGIDSRVFARSRRQRREARRRPGRRCARRSQREHRSVREGGGRGDAVYVVGHARALRDALTKPALITSISTNAVNAHEIDPAWLPEMDVYCDYRATTPASAGEMKLAAQHGWSPQKVKGGSAVAAGGYVRKARVRAARVLPLDRARPRRRRDRQ
ncbi:hypothetical protein BZM27_12785 [Paraburkholderia steynii]|uniref:Ornithine cyclodeaminase n=1 Tax=Paraburkholderia steynii TaxID=1245441 RepID=A0A4R0XDC3_9BURK|nr:hypothetical protein BZM27_12785 [Paraburkholderia steynii]